MTQFFNGEINTDSVVGLILALESDEAQQIDLYFSSENGGCLPDAEVLIDYLSTSIKDITLIGHWCLVSAALAVYLRAVCKKRLLPDTYGMVHIADIDVSTKSIKNKDPWQTHLVSDVEAHNKTWLKERSDFFTRKEMVYLKGGGDLYLPHDRLVKYVDRFGLVLVEEPEKDEATADEN